MHALRALSVPTALTALVLACSPPRELPATPTFANLLARTPDGILEQPGRLEPSDPNQWGAQGGSGWRTTVMQEEGVRFVPTSLPRAVLDLPAGTPRDRTLVLELWSRNKEDQPARAEVHLNGIEIAVLELGTKPAEHRIEAPATLWRRGSNELVFETRVGGDRKLATSLALARVEYDEPRRLVQAAGRITLEPDTGLLYAVDARAGLELYLAGEGSSQGRLRIGFQWLDPVRGGLSPADEPPFSLSPDDLREGARIPLPTGRSGTLGLELVWESPGGELRLEEARVLGANLAPRPPVILIGIDTLAARHLSLYGYDRETSPRLEELAREAVVFENCRSNAPWTLPSFMALLSGLYPPAHQLEIPKVAGVSVDTWERWQLARNRWTLAEALRSSGYRTAGFVDNAHWLSHRFGIPQGFETWNTDAGEIDLLDPRGGILHLLPRVLDWVDDQEGEPFFLFLHALDVHAPYLFARAAEEELPGFEGDPLWGDEEVLAGGTIEQHGAVPFYMARTIYPDGEVPTKMPLAPLVAAYDEGILVLDQLLEELARELGARGIWEEALVILVSDHGESFAHGSYGHSEVYSDVLSIPLVVRLPGGREGGRRVAQAVQSVDVYPTVLELLGLAGADFRLHGRSLVPLLEGEADAPRTIYSFGGRYNGVALEHDGWKLVVTDAGAGTSRDALLTHPDLSREWLEENLPELVDAPFTGALRRELDERPDVKELTRELRELLGGPRYELYNLRQDPRETENLADARPDIVEELLERLAAERRRGEEARDTAQSMAPPVSFSEEDLDALRKLGYVDEE